MTDAPAKRRPAAIVIAEPIGWMDNGILRQFNDGQMVTSADDIDALIAVGAQFWELK